MDSLISTHQFNEMAKNCIYSLVLLFGVLNFAWIINNSCAGVKRKSF